MFLKNMGLAKILLLNILLVVFVVIIILGTLWIYDEYATFHKEAGRMRLEYIESQKTMIKEEVSQIVDYVEYIRSHHKGTEEQIQSEVLGWINEFRYGENGYIFVNTFKGITLAHYKKENIGKNRIDLTDSNGVRINEELINVSKNPDGGYVNYVGTIKPDTNEPASKIGYAQSIDDWQWSIGTGVYVDDIEVIIAEKRVILQKEVRTRIQQIAVVLSAVIVLAILFAIFFSRKVKRESTVFTSFFKEAGAGNKQVDTSELSIQEFKIIGDHANSMLLAKDEVERARRHVEEELKEYRDHLEVMVEERAKELEEKNKKLEESQQSLALLLEDVNESRAELEKRVSEVEQLNSAMVNLMEDLRVSNESLETTTRQLGNANKELEAFAYSVSHDLRAPLRSVDGFSQILLEDYSDILDEKGKHYLERARAGTQNMGQLIDDILNFSRIGRQAMKMKKINMESIAREVYNSLEDEWKGRKVDFNAHKCPPAAADLNLIKIVIMNLLSNALKFTGSRKEAKIEVGSENKDEQTVFFVKDNGVGFDMKYADKLFTPFQRLHRAEEYEGTGIGLAIVQRIIHRHGGRIWVESKVGKGTTFYFTLTA